MNLRERSVDDNPILWFDELFLIVVSSLPNSAWSVQQAKIQGQRELLAKFWIGAPTDLLEMLWQSAVGKATIDLVEELKEDTQLMPAEIELRNEINTKLSEGLQQPLATQLLSANFLFSPKERLRIQNPEQSLPAWFVTIYRKLYETSIDSNFSSNINQSQQEINTQNNDLTKFPDNLQDLISNKIQLNRMLGLSNLYYIDPEDKEILDELLEVRRSFCQAIQRCTESSLEELWTNHLQERYWSMVRCGIQSQDLSQIDDEIKTTAVKTLSPGMGGGFDKPGATNALLIALLYFEPGTLTINEPEKNIPIWLRENFNEIFLQPLLDKN